MKYLILINQIKFKMKNRLRLACCLLLLSYLKLNACAIFIANDGKNVWVGNNEDGNPETKYRLWFYPAHNNNYGHVIWTELYIGKLFYGLAYMIPQGGLNEHGLFADYTAIDKVPAVKDPNKKNKKGDISRLLLQKCKTVKEALALINQYNLINLTGAQLMMAMHLEIMQSYTEAISLLKQVKISH
jgi:penicillin V acylase-like amidase (Ntn superfamily)